MGQNKQENEGLQVLCISRGSQNMAEVMGEERCTDRGSSEPLLKEEIISRKRRYFGAASLSENTDKV